MNLAPSTISTPILTHPSLCMPSSSLHSHHNLSFNVENFVYSRQCNNAVALPLTPFRPKVNKPSPIPRAKALINTKLLDGHSSFAQTCFRSSSTSSSTPSYILSWGNLLDSPFPPGQKWANRLNPLRRVSTSCLRCSLMVGVKPSAAGQEGRGTECCIIATLSLVTEACDAATVAVKGVDIPIGNSKSLYEH